ncbi:hypothetical protein COV93_08240 [Candidatus Woesearchaeota archaeon CG11_big_fil_rev_8_21_14_0_20_43_8]|nr:MAG: hypothetical protein COV93_08240 [Candidatus Woesearchaeota archaeon CG11_big_fil_rev_8_21_14_0_20_43_8]
MHWKFLVGGSILIFAMISSVFAFSLGEFLGFGGEEPTIVQELMDDARHETVKSVLDMPDKVITLLSCVFDVAVDKNVTPFHVANKRAFLFIFCLSGTAPRENRAL